ncbi:maleylacetate reductase [Amycolatopsis sp. MEPSY49]|uniref:maleylacetate reductase n=1 Tax=Amycolatopsis sp. MEPSY49 TaxID=3151600 RepID=UPI003EF9EEFB
MTRDFVHENPPGRVVFGAGARHRLPRELERAGLRRPLVVCAPGEATLAAELAPPGAELHPHAAMHVPAAVAAEAVAAAAGADGCVAVGGGSAIGLAKAVAKETGLPVAAVPTTYSGSEMTPIWGITGETGKTTGRDPKVRPVLVVYDPELTLSLPTAFSVTSGVNALAHVAEALYAPDCSPVTALVAKESARVTAAALPRVSADPLDLDARTDLLYGSWLAGTALGSTTMSLHHKLCHILGGTFDLPHAPVHTAVLPHVLAVNLPAAPAAGAALKSAWDTPDPAGHVFRLAQGLGAEMSLKALGLPENGIDAVIEQALAAPYANPVPVTEAVLRHLLHTAFTGGRPTEDS